MPWFHRFGLPAGTTIPVNAVSRLISGMSGSTSPMFFTRPPGNEALASTAIVPGSLPVWPLIVRSRACDARASVFGGRMPSVIIRLARVFGFPDGGDAPMELSGTQ